MNEWYMTDQEVMKKFTSVASVIFPSALLNALFPQFYGYRMKTFPLHGSVYFIKSSHRVKNGKKWKQCLFFTILNSTKTY